IIKVSATKVLFDIFFELSSLRKKLFFDKYQTKSQAAIRLLPSVNEWFFTTRYKRFAAFSSMLGYRSFPSKVWSITAMELLKDWSFSLPKRLEPPNFTRNCSIAFIASL